jgi:3-hydroxymyristoyl/3-hydroxydecanoyl-(acyl carrier protein) dehydratase
MTTTRSFTTTVRIPASHPSLAGHFPGNPVAPGVVLLVCVLDEAQRWLGSAPVATGLTQAKFTAPLLPEQTAQLELTLQGKELRFGLTRDAVSIARGAFTLGSSPAKVTPFASG